ncbi:DUF5753 domain-containing protein [Nocardia sp. NPDC088792]|uniref:DUF5753 domain-containing protein n=1 Tax=Nocardia sp. NPDC088792 TaxID=3364332 RepID=UPI003826023E
MRAASAKGTGRRVSVQRISDWRAGRNVPASFESLVPVLLTLIELAGSRLEVSRGLSNLGAWHRLWKGARAEVDSVRSSAQSSPHRLRREALSPLSETGLRLEATATMIRAFECLLVPELLQTDDYARAIVTLGYWNRAEQMRRAELRRRRREILGPCGGPTVWAVLDEAVLHRPVGGPHVLRTQLEHLVEISSRPNVIIQVLPFLASGYAAVGTSFTMLRFAGHALPDIVCLPQLTGAAYLDRPDELDPYRRAMDRLALQADPQDRSRARLIAAATEL